MQGELQNSEGARLSHFTGFGCRKNAVEVLASRSDHELSNAPRCEFWLSCWVLRCKTLIVMIVPIYHDVCVCSIERIPKLAEGQLRTTPPEFAEFFQALTAARVVVEVNEFFNTHEIYRELLQVPFTFVV